MTAMEIVKDINDRLDRIEAMLKEMRGEAQEAEAQAVEEPQEEEALPAPAAIADPALALAALWAAKMREAFEEDALAARRRFAPEYMEKIESGWYFRNWEIDDTCKTRTAQRRRRAMHWVMEDAERILAEAQEKESGFERDLSLAHGWHYVCEARRALACLCAVA